jgi:chemotaxis protein methyltransferase CheR
MQPREAGALEVGDAMRELVAFRELNLIGQWPMKGRFDAIFCRNVVIYFDEPTQHRIWGRFRGLLQPAGRLYVGHSERVTDDAFRSDGLTTYALIGGRK